MIADSILKMLYHFRSDLRVKIFYILYSEIRRIFLVNRNEFELLQYFDDFYGFDRIELEDTERIQGMAHKKKLAIKYLKLGFKSL